MTIEDRLSTHLKDTSARLTGRPAQVEVVVAAAGARSVLTRLLLAGGVVVAGLVVVGAMMARPRGGEPEESTRVVVSPYVELGGRLGDVNDRLVFTVSTETPSYWRLASLDVYEDGIWKVAGSFAAPNPSLDETATRQGDRRTVRHEIDVVNLDAIWLPAAPEPVQVTVDGGAPITVDLVTNAMTVPNERLDSDGLRYTVVSSVAVPTPEQLRAAPRADARIVGQTHASPDGVPAEIQAQALALTAGLPTDYDKVMAIHDHLRSFTHVGDPEIVPIGQSSAVRLLETQEGSASDFASAMALMARALGIPSRVAIGFTPGERVDGGSDTASGRITFEVTSHDAHAWTEIYFQDVGWVGFEPTPGQTMPLAESYDGTTGG